MKQRLRFPFCENKLEDTEMERSSMEDSNEYSYSPHDVVLG